MLWWNVFYRQPQLSYWTALTENNFLKTAFHTHSNWLTEAVGEKRGGREMDITISLWLYPPSMCKLFCREVWTPWWAYPLHNHRGISQCFNLCLWLIFLSGRCLTTSTTSIPLLFNPALWNFLQGFPTILSLGSHFSPRPGSGWCRKWPCRVVHPKLETHSPAESCSPDRLTRRFSHHSGPTRGRTS